MANVLHTDPPEVDEVVSNRFDTEAILEATRAEVTASQARDPRDAGDAANGRKPQTASADQVAKAYELARHLAAASSLNERLPIYQEASRTLIFIAAARWPELMPELNGDIEIRTLTSADVLG